MPRNIEIKARIANVDALLPRAQALAGGAPPALIEQDDQFFRVPPGRGRLKLRRFADGSAELIQSRRPAGSEARASASLRGPGPDAAALAKALTRALGAAGRVLKRRWLMLVGQTRIHLDRVQGLGDFLELEVVLRDGQSDAEGQAIAEQCMLDLGLAAAPRLAGAYVVLDGGPAGRADGHHSLP